MSITGTQKLIISAGAIIILGAGGWYFFGPGSDMSGTYVGQNAKQAFLAQIIQGQGGQLTGFYEEASLSETLGVSQENIPLTGQRDGNTFIVTLQQNDQANSTDSVSLSGTYSSSSITLNGEGNGFTVDLTLGKGTEAQYTDLVAGLQKQAQATENLIQQQEAAQMAAEQAAGAVQAAADQKAQVAQAVANKLNNDLGDVFTNQSIFPSALQELREEPDSIKSVTTTMQVNSAREASYGGSSSPSGAAILEVIEQANSSENDEMTRLQNQYQSSQQSGTPALLGQVNDDDATCAALNATVSLQAAFTGPPAELSSCLALEKATPALQQEADQIEAAYQAVFSTWKLERVKQQAIVEQSEH